MNNTTTSIVRVLFLITLVLATILPANGVSAALARCRTDPIFVLSNGDSLNVSVDISTDATNVRNLLYTVHVPPGVTVRRVTYTAGGLGTKETYKVVQDSVAKIYKTDTVVTTQNTGSVAVIATTILNKTYSASVSGYNGQVLTVTVSKP